MFSGPRFVCQGAFASVSLARSAVRKVLFYELSQGPPVKRWLERHAGVILLLWMAFALRVGGLGARSLWYDEAYLWWATTQVNVREMLALSAGELVPPAHYFLLRTWIPLAGASEFALRFPSVLYGLLALAALARMARRLSGKRSAGTWALLLGALAPTLIWASRETRMYGAFIAWSLLAGMALVETLLALEPRPRRRWAWLWGAAALGAMASLTLSAFWLVGQALFALLALIRRPWQEVRAWLQAMFPPTLLAGLIFLPWVLEALPSLGQNATYWEGYLPIAEFLRTSIAGMTVFDLLPSAWKVAAGGLILVASFGALILTRRRPLAGLYPLLQLMPLGLMAVVFRNLPKWGSRHASGFAPLPVLALAIGWGMAAQLHGRRRRTLARLGLGVCSVLVVALSAQADANLLTDPTYATEDWRSVAHYVMENRAPGDVIIVETGSVFPAWAYYAGFEGLLPLPDDKLLDVTHVLDYANGAAALNAALQNTSQVWLVTWLETITDPTGVVPALLGELGAEVPTLEFHGLGLRRFALARRADFPPEPDLTERLATPTLPHLTLWGYRLPQAPQPVDSTLDVWTFWVTEDPAAHGERFYQVALRLLDARGDEWARFNGTPASGDYRPSRWQAGTPVLGRYPLTPDPWTPPGSTTPTLTVYVAGAASASVTLQPVELLPATAPPPLPENAIPVEPGAATAGASPLELLGFWLSRETMRPCEPLEGRAFWAVPAPYAVADRRDVLRLSLAEHAVTLPLTAANVTSPLPAGTRFATQFRLPISCRALDAEAPLTAELLTAAGAPLARWRGPEISIVAGREFQPPDGLLPATGDFGPGVAALLGYRLEPEPGAGQPFTLTLYWRAEETGDSPYNVFVHVTAPGTISPLLGQHDSWPALGGKPTTTWVTGEIVADEHPLAGLPAGSYDLRVGLYDEAGPLAVSSAASAPPQNAVVIPLTVRPQ